MKLLLILAVFAVPALAQNPNPCGNVTNTAVSGQVLSAAQAGSTPPCTWVNNGGGGGGSGTVTSVTIAGTTNQIAATGTCTGTVTVSCTLSIPSGFVIPGTINGLTITTTTGTLTISSAKVLTVSNSLTLAGTDGVTLTFPSTNATIARTDSAQTFTGVQTFSTPIAAGSGGSGVANTATHTLGTSNQNWATLGTGIVKNTTTTGAISDAASSDVIGLWTGTCNSSSFLNGSGACSSPSGAGTVTSVIVAGTTNQITASGTCTITSSGTCTLSLPSGLVLPGTIDGLTITTTTGTLTIASAKVLTVNNSLTLAGTDGVTLTFPATNATIARTDAAQTFTGTQTFGTINATTLVATGIVDGTAPVTVTTGSSATLGSTNASGYTFNQNATAGTAVTYTLPTAAAGKQYCVGNSFNGSAANTGVLEILTSASGQFIIYTDGTLSATGGFVTSGGAGSDFACVVGVDSTHWYFRPSSGTWTKH